MQRDDTHVSTYLPDLKQMDGEVDCGEFGKPLRVAIDVNVLPYMVSMFHV